MEPLFIEYSDELSESLPEEYLEKLRKRKFEDENLNDIKVVDDDAHSVLALVPKNIDLTNKTVMEYVENAGEILDRLLGPYENTVHIVSTPMVTENNIVLNNVLTPIEYARTIKSKRKRGRK